MTRKVLNSLRSNFDSQVLYRFHRTMERALGVVQRTYHRAPVTFGLIGSYLVTRLVTNLWQDYVVYRALGGGGPLPDNLVGWLVHCFVLSPLSLGKKWTRGSLSVSYVPKSSGGLCHVNATKPRKGSRPVTAGVAPHRQLNQTPYRDSGSDDGNETPTSMLLIATMDKLATASPSHLTSGCSRIEPSSHALFAVSHTLVTDGPSRSTRSAAFPSALSQLFLSSMKGGEFFHVHARDSRDKSHDGSIHCILHPEDAALVIERGWGELHALAGCPSYSGFWFGWPSWLLGVSNKTARWWSWSIPTNLDRANTTAMKGLPPTYCMVYAPRDADELKVVETILHGAVAFATGMKV